jgi:hypothetical protein
VSGRCPAALVCSVVKNQPRPDNGARAAAKFNNELAEFNNKLTKI